MGGSVWYYHRTNDSRCKGIQRVSGQLEISNNFGIKRLLTSMLLFRKCAEEEKKSEERRIAADFITKSYSLTEVAANADPSIAEQNKKIAQQRKEWEEEKMKHDLRAKSAQDRKGQKLAADLATANDPVLSEAKRQAEEMVSLAYKLTEVKAMNDPVIMEANQKIAEQRRLFAETKVST